MGIMRNILNSPAAGISGFLTNLKVDRVKNMQAQTIFLIIVVISILSIILVMAYGMYQENRYRQEVFRQFGHHNKDTLMSESDSQVRDAPAEQFSSVPLLQSEKKNEEGDDDYRIFSQQDTSSLPLTSPTEKGGKLSSSDVESTQDYLDVDAPPASLKNKIVFKRLRNYKNLEKSSVGESIVNTFSKIFPKKSEGKVSSISLKELENLDLPWFNRCFDYLAFVSLKRPQELSSLPRFTTKHRIKLVACNLDNQFQEAEAIPGVSYKAYVIGLQAISRSGLVSREELQQFGKQVEDFAFNVDGSYQLTDVDEFYKIAKPMDELCARVDQIIGLHLVSRETVSGIDLRAALEKNGFTLSHDGVFYYPNYEEERFKVVNMDETPFTTGLLATNHFKGFSILFDITHVPPGAKNFDTFMGLAVKLAKELDLDLVDDELNELSSEWLKNIGSYVLQRQKEMEEVGITPGGELAQRLFI